jgi:D-alanine-D-alanine ligase-like ATP-grasp enzyme
VDLVIDADLGPLMLEVNARPGLQIQVINGQGLAPVLAEAAR